VEPAFLRIRLGRKGTIVSNGLAYYGTVKFESTSTTSGANVILRPYFINFILS
jgi:hypothetical protein